MNSKDEERLAAFEKMLENIQRFLRILILYRLLF